MPSVGIVVIVAGFVDATVVAALAVAYAPFYIVTSIIDHWILMFTGFAAGLIVAFAIEPYRLGVGPRGITLAFPGRRLFVPWNLLVPESDRASRCKLGYVDPGTMKSATLLLGTEEAQRILDLSYAAQWSWHSIAARGWKEALQ